MKSAQVRDAIFGAIYPRVGPMQYSLREIAAASGVSVATLSRYMRGGVIRTDAQDKLIDWLQSLAQPATAQAAGQGGGED